MKCLSVGMRLKIWLGMLEYGVFYNVVLKFEVVCWNMVMGAGVDCIQINSV